MHFKVLRTIGIKGGYYLFAITLLGLLLSSRCSKHPNDSENESNWVILNEGGEIESRKLFFADSLNGWALYRFPSFSRTFWRTTNGGTSWTLEAVTPHTPSPHFRDLTFLDTQNGWLVGSQGIIYHTLDGGETWTIDDHFYTGAGQPIIRRVCFPDSLHGWLGFGERNIARSTDGGETWQLIEMERRLLQALGGDVAFVADYFGAHIYRTTDSGATWQEIYPGIQYPLSSAEVSFLTPEIGWATINWELEYRFGALLIASEDGGITWDTVLNLENNQLTDLHMLPSREGWVRSIDPPVLHTTDGLTWFEDPLPELDGRTVHALFARPGPDVWLLADGLVLSRSKQ